MILQSIAMVLVFYTSCITGVEYTYDQLAGGWLKYHESASWEDAYLRCDTEGAVLASPLNSQIRDGIKDYLTRISKSGVTIHTGVQATLDTSDYYSLEGVDLKKMPVLIEMVSVNYTSAESCVKWRTEKAEVMYSDCQEEIPFVCFKKRKNLAIAGCGTVDTEYKYYEQSGSCYKKHTKGLTWKKAYQQCKNEGGYLAIPNNQLEKKVIMALNDKYPFSVLSDTSYDKIFLGLRKWEKNGPWMTVKGQTLEESGFAGWAASEPNNLYGIEYCGNMFRDGYINDTDCDIKFAYICEKEPEILYI